MDHPEQYVPRTTPLMRAAGIAALAGAILWPVALAYVASGALSDCATASGCTIDRSLLGPIGIAGLLIAIGVAGLELRATSTIGLFDLIGDLTLGTAGALLVLAAIAGSLGLLGPGLLLTLIGSVIFGAKGWDGQRRPRYGSLLIAMGAGTVIVFLLLASTVGTATVGGFETTALGGFLLFSLGWAWLGVSLALGRPLAPAPARRPPAGQPTKR
ncbi:MAG TPA: hypothetical protein VNF73_16075 [Candidatus Saccharimonadales bacterium]|nr:hypothetical protein [Candidatus Saccharimonadales bacterium]